jgi:hypothetical protein
VVARSWIETFQQPSATSAFTGWEENWLGDESAIQQTIAVLEVWYEMKRDSTPVIAVMVLVVVLAAIVTGGPMMGWGMMGWGAMTGGMMGGGMMGGTYIFNPVWGIVTFLLNGLTIGALVLLIWWLVGTLSSTGQSRS